MEAAAIGSRARKDGEDAEKGKNDGGGKKTGGVKRTSDTTGFTSQGPPKSARPDESVRSGGCFNCGQQGHIARNCTNVLRCNHCKEEGRKVSSCPQVVCYKCGIKGHTNTYCPINTTSADGVPTTSFAGSSHIVAGRGRGQPNARIFNHSQGSGGHLHAMETVPKPLEPNFDQGMPLCLRT